jgi:hypothetical protein
MTIRTAVVCALACPIVILPSLFFATMASAQVDQVLPTFGGGGGGQFTARCAQGQMLNGFELRTGDDVDGIRPICITVQQSGDVQGRSFDAPLNGGPGAGATYLGCPDLAPVVTAVWRSTEEAKTEIINGVHVFCGKAATDQPVTTYPTAVFDGPPDGDSRHGFWSDQQSCPSGLVAVGISGHSGTWLDSFGLICGALVLAPNPENYVASIGRSTTSSSDGRSICEMARDARARGSVAAPNLEAKCEAEKANAAREAQAQRVSASKAAADQLQLASLGQVNPWADPASQRSVCDMARDARARGSVAAPNLEAQCAASAAAPPPAPASKAAVVISQVYGGGGSEGGSFANDFVELFNRSQSAVKLDGWSLQYASGNGKEWKVMKLKGTIAPGQYLLLQQSAGSLVGGNPLPTPDLKGKLALAAGMGKVALLETTQALRDLCPKSSKLVDFVGYGSANCAESIPAQSPGRTTAAVRDAGGCTDTDRNAADLQILAATPRNSTTAAIQCAK